MRPVSVRYNETMNTQPHIVMIVFNLLFATRIEDAARSVGAAVLIPIDQAAFLTALRHGARLVIIDSSAEDVPWMEWVCAAKENLATEEVPILAFGSHVDVGLRNRALGAGVDRYLARSNFSEGLNEIVAAAVREVTDDPCSEQLPAGALRGIEEYNAGQYFEQHETLELVWRAELTSRPRFVSRRAADRRGLPAGGTRQCHRRVEDDRSGRQVAAAVSPSLPGH